ncbi:hypothetical protein AB4254_08655 [Vibrio breoganii]
MTEYFTGSEQELIYRAIGHLASVCDNAQLRDNHGFNRADSHASHHLTVIPFDEWGDQEFVYCWSILFKYRRQIEQMFRVDIGAMYRKRFAGLSSSQITSQLSQLASESKSKLNFKDVLSYDKNADLFVLTKHSYKTSENFTAAMSMIAKDHHVSEAGSVWEVGGEYAQGLAHLIDVYVWKRNLHAIGGSYELLLERSKTAIDIADLKENGFDERDVISVIFEDDYVLEIKARGSYRYAKLLSGYRYKKERQLAVARLAFPSDLAVIRDMVRKEKYKIVFEGRNLTYLDLKELVGALPKCRYLSLVSVKDNVLVVGDEERVLGYRALESTNVYVKLSGKTVVIIPKNEKGLRSVVEALHERGLSLGSEVVTGLKNALRLRTGKKYRLTGGVWQLAFPKVDVMNDELRAMVGRAAMKWNPKLRVWEIPSNHDRDILLSRFVAKYKFGKF